LPRPRFSMDAWPRNSGSGRRSISTALATQGQSVDAIGRSIRGGLVNHADGSAAEAIARIFIDVAVELAGQSTRAEGDRRHPPRSAARAEKPTTVDVIDRLIEHVLLSHRRLTERVQDRLVHHLLVDQIRRMDDARVFLRLLVEHDLHDTVLAGRKH
jgi:hypothetical protein